ncbi:hypothetical protein B0I35DRAFT_437410 [Stachybotrys elegans]|uniref:Uncharacterized protein n=1 Tax=Stachybotrys elegans TaxID=80388 RepID=A0A8K0SML4_9HYPO|nr:hypothetical protein B0I35DRAFT_437410 [Stachybotrys elegans]
MKRREAKRKKVKRKKVKRGRRRKILALAPAPAIVTRALATPATRNPNKSPKNPRRLTTPIQPAHRRSHNHLCPLLQSRPQLSHHKLFPRDLLDF